MQVFVFHTNETILINDPPVGPAAASVVKVKD